MSIFNFGQDRKREREDKMLEERIAELRRLKALVAPTLAEISEIEKQIKDVIISRCESFAHNGVTVQFRAGATRVTWDAKALDGYLAAHPEIADFRRETTGKPTAAITIKERQ